jgi:molybdopterin/thiamine biosynthesis adenylyltransferase
MDVIDGDPQVESHNLNRQILLVDGVGRPKAPVLTRQLQQLDPAGSYRDVIRFIEQPEDLEPLEGVDALIMAPDNDAARLRGADAAWHRAVPYAVGGTGPGGGQLVIQQPGRACYRCITGRTDQPASATEDAGTNSCALGANQSIVASNMVVAGLLVSELREAMARRRSQNLRFFGGRSGNGNRLGRMTSDPKCPHLDDAGSNGDSRSIET